MSDLFGATHAELDRIWDRLDLAPTIVWGTVTQVSPLLVQLDGDIDTTGAPVTAPARSVVAGLMVGSRVVCVKQHRRVLVLTSSGAPAVPALRRGTATERTATTSQYWDFWQDTDGDERLYVGDKSGGWRQHSGLGTSASRAWDDTGTSMAGRTDTHTIPTILEANEVLTVTATTSGTGFAALSVSSLVRNPADTSLTLRFMQVLSTDEQAYTFAWQITQL